MQFSLKRVCALVVVACGAAGWIGTTPTASAGTVENQVPITAGDFFLLRHNGRTVSIDVLANDIDDDPLTIIDVWDFPNTFSVVISPDAKKLRVTTPLAAFAPFEMRYTVTDGREGHSVAAIVKVRDITTPVAAPGNVDASVLDVFSEVVSNYLVTWTDTNSGETIHELRSRYFDPATATWTSWEANPTPLVQGVTQVGMLVTSGRWQYQLRARYLGGLASPWVTKTLVVNQPLRPFSFTARLAPGIVALDWHTEVTTETGYQIERSDRDPVTRLWGPWTTFRTVTSATTSTIDLVSGGSHRYRMRAVQSIDEYFIASAWTVPVIAR